MDCVEEVREFANYRIISKWVNVTNSINRGMLHGMRTLLLACWRIGRVGVKKQVFMGFEYRKMNAVNVRKSAGMECATRHGLGSH